MITNIRVDTSDSDRELIAKSLGNSGLASRKDITEAVQSYIRELIDRAEYKIEEDYELPRNARTPDTGRPGRDSNADLSAGHSGLPDNGDPIADFRPSRGDESYMFKPRDPALKELQSNLLDAIEALEKYTWKHLEANRER